jgi:outer membrane receptor protein involved in Fe transport
VFKRFDNCSTMIDCTRHRLPYAPEFSSALTANYAQPLPSLGGKLKLYGEYSHRSTSFTDPVNNPATQKMSARDLVNVRIGFFPDGSQWEVGLWVRNLFDEDAAANRGRDFLGNEFTRRVDPRTVGIEARFSF